MLRGFSLLWACLIACGAPSIPAPENASVTNPASAPPPFAVSCADPAHCPASIGMLTSPRETGTERCTGFLVTQTLLLTAGHCLAESIRQTGRSCSDHLVYFPSSSGRNREPSRCLQVHSLSYRSDGDILDEDWALVELDGESVADLPPLHHDRTRPAPTTPLIASS